MDDPNQPPPPPPPPPTIRAMSPTEREAHRRHIGDVEFANQTIQELVGVRTNGRPDGAPRPAPPPPPTNAATATATAATIREMSHEERRRLAREMGDTAFTDRFRAELRAGRVSVK